MKVMIQVHQGAFWRNAGKPLLSQARAVFDCISCSVSGFGRLEKVTVMVSPFRRISGGRAEIYSASVSH